MAEDVAADPFIATVKRLAINERLDLDTAKLLIAEYKKTRPRSMARPGQVRRTRL